VEVRPLLIAPRTGHGTYGCGWRPAVLHLLLGLPLLFFLLTNQILDFLALLQQARFIWIHRQATPHLAQRTRQILCGARPSGPGHALLEQSLSLMILDFCF